MQAIDLNKQILDDVVKTDIYQLDGHFGMIGTGQYAEIYNRTGQPNLYYQWLHCLVKRLRPKQIVELGAAAGISTILMATAAQPDTKIYSVDVDPQAWRWMADYQQVVKILGDTRNLSIYPPDLDLSNTDLWFFDSEHTKEMLSAEVNLYKPFWKKGSVVVFDDIHLNPGMEEVWNSLDFDKCDNTNPCHYSGFGFFIV